MIAESWPRSGLPSGVFAASDAYPVGIARPEPIL